MPPSPLLPCIWAHQYHLSRGSDPDNTTLKLVINEIKFTTHKIIFETHKQFTITLLMYTTLFIYSVQFSHSATFHSLWPHGLQHARPPCPSPTLRVYSNSCPLSQWWHPTISSSVVPFSRPQSFPESGSFQMSQFFALGGQSIGVSASASVLPMNIQDWFPSW